MKATELMIGDWVMNACDTPRKVYGLAQDQVTYELECGGLNTTNPNLLYPIPLTEEILVKNGFEKGRDDDVTTFKYGNLFLFYYPDGTGLYNYNSHIIINYVHQLQHLLRLCGIEKEITI